MLEFGGEETPASMRRLYHDIRRFVYPPGYRAFLLWMLRRHLELGDDIPLRIIGHLARACMDTHWGTWITPEGRIGVRYADMLRRGNEEVHAEVKRVLQTRPCADNPKLHVVFCSDTDAYALRGEEHEVLQYWTEPTRFPKHSVAMEWDK